MAEQYYQIPENPQYDIASIREILDTDPVRASTIINPVILRILENIAAVKEMTDHGMEEIRTSLRDVPHTIVCATRPRDPTKPTYGLEGDAQAVALEVAPYTGTAEAGVVVSGELYDAKNVGFAGESHPDGTIIIKESEESQNG